jgi:anti-sigma factor RsiW
MADCAFNLEIQAYHDGELPAERRSTVEEHLAGCPACAAELAELKNLSAVFAAEPVAELSQIALHRLHRKIDNEMDRGLIRFGWSLSAVAASILLVASAWLVKVDGSAQAASASPTPDEPPWVSVSLAASHDPVLRDASTPAEQWYLADAWTRSDEVPQE